MKPRFLAFSRHLVLTSTVMMAAMTPLSSFAADFTWGGTDSSDWTVNANWSTGTAPTYGTDYTSDTLRINAGPNAAVYNPTPGPGDTTTFRAGRAFIVAGDLTVSSGTLAAARTTNSGSEPIMANGVNASILINGGAVDFSGHLNTFLFLNSGVSNTSDLTISSGSFSSNGFNFQTAGTGTGTINLDGGFMAVTAFTRPAATGSTTFNLDGGTLRARAASTSFLPALTGLQTIVEDGGAVIDTNTFNITIAQSLEHDPALGISLDGGLTKNSTGTLTLSGTNTYNGGTTINAGAILISNDANLGASTGAITFNATDGESSLFVNASVTDSNRTVTLASTATGNIRMNAANPFTNAGKFTGAGNLRFTQTGSGFCTATLAAQNNDFSGSLTIDQNGSNSNAIRVIVNSLTDPSGAGNIICKTVGTSAFPAFRLGADATSSLTLTNRRIELAGLMGTGSTFSIANDNTTYPITINSDLLVSGTAGTRRLALSGVAGPVNVFAGVIADEVDSVVSVTKANSAAVWTLSGNNSHSGGTTLSGGTAGSQLNINSSTALGTGTFVISGGDNGKIDNTSGAAITLGTNNAQTWNSNFTFVGSNDLNLGTGAVTMGGNRTLFVQGSTLTVGGAISGAFNLTKGSTGGTLVLTGSSTYTGSTVISGGILNISSIADYGVNSAIGAPASGDIQLGAANNFCTLAYTGAANSTNRTVQLGDATPANTGVGSLKNNGSGALTFTAPNFNPTIPGITATRTLWLGGSYTGGANEIQGIIQDNDVAGKVNVGKANDASTWQLSGANTYTGSTIVQGGSLILGAAGSIASSTALSISAGATLDTSAQATHTIPATQPVTFGIDAGGSGSTGKIVAAGLNIASAVVTYNIAGTPDDPAYVLATYTPGQLTGTFASVPTPPTGYTLDYAYEGNKIALVQATGTPYTTWAGSALFNDDANGDGVKNGLAWILGATDKDVSALNKLPVAGTPTGYLTLSFKRVNPYAPAKLYIEYSNNLSAWTKLEIPAGSGTIPSSDVEVEVTPGTPDTVTVKIPTTHASGGKLFGRLSATEN